MKSLVEEYQSRFSHKDYSTNDVKAKVVGKDFLLSAGGKEYFLDSQMATNDFISKCNIPGYEKLHKSDILQFESIEPGIFEKHFQKFQKCCTRSRNWRLIFYDENVVGVKSDGYSVTKPSKVYEWFTENYGEPKIKLTPDSYSFSYVEPPTGNQLKVLRNYGVEKEFQVGVKFTDSLVGWITTTLSQQMLRLICKNGMVSIGKGQFVSARHLGTKQFVDNLFDTQQKFELETVNNDITSFVRYLSNLNEKTVDDPMKLLAKYSLGKKELVESTFNHYNQQISEFTGKPMGNSLYAVMNTITDKYLNENILPHKQIENAKLG